MTGKIFELWLQLASEDLRSAEVLLQAELFNMVCFHSQQCVEKSLKALMARLNKPIPRIHDLVKLHQLAQEALGDAIELDVEGLMLLNDVYSDSRYPRDVGLLPGGQPDQAYARKAYDSAAESFNILNQLIKKIRKLL
jgi:HEPN domain-containing protein